MSLSMSEEPNSAFDSRRTVALTMLRTCVQGMLLEVNIKFSRKNKEILTVLNPYPYGFFDLSSIYIYLIR